MRIETYNQTAGTENSSRQRMPVSSSDFREQMMMRKSKAQDSNNAWLKEELLARFPRTTDNNSGETGLNKTAVYPMALYNAFLNGERFMTEGVVDGEYESFYSRNPLTGGLYFNYPSYGIGSMEYDLWLMKKAIQAYFTESAAED